MGSFNVGCGLSNLSIDEGDKTGFVILGAKKDYLAHTRKTPNPGHTQYIYSTDLYKPLFPPVFGVYDDYGRITNIESSVTTKAIEQLFHRPVETVINCIASDRELYSPYGEINTAYMIPGHLLADYNVSIGKNLLALGFTQEGEGTYSYRNYIIEENGKDRYWNITDPTGTPLIVNHHASYAYELMDMFAFTTGLFPGFEEKDWKAIRLLHELSGMFFLREVFEKMSVSISQEYSSLHFYKTFSKAWDEFMNEFKPDEHGNVRRFASSWDMEANRFLRESTCLAPEMYDMLNIYQGSYEFGMVGDLIAVATSTNRMLMPSLNGEQFGNTDASLAMARVSTEILRERKERYNDELDE